MERKSDKELAVEAAIAFMTSHNDHSSRAIEPSAFVEVINTIYETLKNLK